LPQEVSKHWNDNLQENKTNVSIKEMEREPIQTNITSAGEWRRKYTNSSTVVDGFKHA
jgi:hypothetical protein